MEFVELSTFEKPSKLYLGENELHELQIVLLIRPEIGKVIQSSGGLRKLRWTSAGTGKRSGLRVIYYYVTQDQKIFLVYIYKKSKQEDLNLEQLRYLRLLVGDS